MIKSNLILTCVVLMGILLLVAGCQKSRPMADNPMPQADTTAYDESAGTDSTSDTDFDFAGYDTPPSPVVNPLPAYPEQYRKTGIQGIVVLDVEVLDTGKAGNISIIKSLMSGSDGLDAVAKRAVQSWIFKPALKDGKAVTAHINVPVAFSLKG